MAITNVQIVQQFVFQCTTIKYYISTLSTSAMNYVPINLGNSWSIARVFCRCIYLVIIIDKAGKVY